MSDSASRPLRETFNDVADLYDRVRPGYPSALFEDLAEMIPRGPACRVLEIGCGTGQATVPLAARGYQVIALDLGADMCRVARRNLQRWPAVDVVNVSFERWPLPPEPFDVVFAATSFHWIDPAIRLKKAADALRHRNSMWPFNKKQKVTALPPGEISYSQLDITERFDDNLRLKPDEWTATIPLNKTVTGEEVSGLPPVNATSETVYQFAARLSQLRESIATPNDGVYCPVCHIANIELSKLHEPCPKCGRALLKFGWD